MNHSSSVTSYDEGQYILVHNPWDDTTPFVVVNLHTNTVKEQFANLKAAQLWIDVKEQW